MPARISQMRKQDMGCESCLSLSCKSRRCSVQPVLVWDRFQLPPALSSTMARDTKPIFGLSPAVGCYLNPDGTALL